MMHISQSDKNGLDSSEDISIGLSDIDINTSIREKLIPDEDMNSENEDEDSRYFTIPVVQNCKIRIYKPLIPLKLALFIWYGAGSSFGTFLTIFFKKRGITIAELSTIYAISPAIQLLGPIISGIIADKIGKSKPVLVATILLTVLFVVGLLFAPSMHARNCETRRLKLECHPETLTQEVRKTTCYASMDVAQLTDCDVTCEANATQHCHAQNLTCEMLDGNSSFRNLSLPLLVVFAYDQNNKCYYSATPVSNKNMTYSGCEIIQKMYRNTSYASYPDENCSTDATGRTGILILNAIIFILFYTVYSNTYRFMDVTSMTMVKKHNSDFGRERFFGVSGVLLVSPIVGYLVDATTAEGANKNYDTAFYCFIGMTFLIFPVIYKLDVHIKPPGKNMWLKSVGLISNPDVIAFILVLVSLGAAHGFMRNFMFWFLEGMDPPGFLLGLIHSVDALYGLPFLLTSNWWVEKIGTSHIILLAFLGYVASGIGYSVLYNPWFSLLIEATDIVTYHLLWVAVIRHSHNLAPEGLVATVIATAGGIHHSFGKGVGALAGGFIMNAFGVRTAFRVTAAFCFVCSIFYATFVYVRKSSYTQIPSSDIKDHF